MQTHKILKNLREKWLDSILEIIAEEEATREEFSHQLEQFFDLLLKAIKNNDPGWLKPIIIEWVGSRTGGEEGEQISLNPIMSVIAEQTQKLVIQELDATEALQVMEHMMPIISYSFGEISFNESLINVTQLSAELDRIKTDLARVDKSKSDFIAVAAHELKTPLTLIEGYASMLREKFSKGEDDSSSIAMLKGIDNGTRRLGEIVSDMIDVSLIDNDLLSLRFQPTWINRLIDLIHNDLKNTLDNREQSIEVKQFEGIDEMIYADSERLYQVLYNVLTNAIKYTPDGGKITVDGRKLAGYIEVLITDTGIGVSEKDKDKIFEKFGVLGNAALHSSGKLKFKGGGPGLGLPIAKGILEAHGGTIWVESEGHDETTMPGSTFHILVPIRDEPPDKKLASAAKQKSDNGE